MVIIHETVVTWIDNIYHFICNDPSRTLHSDEEIDSGPKEEINFWGKRLLALTKAHDLLKHSPYQGILAVLQQLSAKTEDFFIYLTVHLAIIFQF